MYIPVHSIEAHEQGVGVGGQMFDVLGHNIAQQYALLLGLRFDHILAVVGVEEKLAGFRVGNKLYVVKVACEQKTEEEVVAVRAEGAVVTRAINYKKSCEKNIAQQAHTATCKRHHIVRFVDVAQRPHRTKHRWHIVLRWRKMWRKITCKMRRKKKEDKTKVVVMQKQ
jgi:hypothetical protein